MHNFQYLIAMILSSIMLLLLFIFTSRNNNKHQLVKMLSACLITIFLWTFALILQILFQYTTINPVFFEGLASFGACFLPIAFMFLGIIFAKTKISFRPIYCLLLIIPIVSTVLMFTNSYHHLFYIKYSTSLKETIYGPYFLFHSIYSYTCIGIGLLYLILYSIKNSGFFSRQSLLICIGVLISLIINILGTIGVLDLLVYATPISFAITIMFIAIAIFKFNFLSVAPIALQRIVDKISDGYIVINEDNKITDFNQTFLNIFETTSNDIRNKNLFELIKTHNINIKVDILTKFLNEVKDSDKTVTIEKHFEQIDKYFHIEINRIENKGNFLGILILLKDITQHTIDMQTIKDNQDMLVEKERLASLGQMIGGIAHNLKTPIMSIAGAAEGLSDLIKEYDSSVGDPEVTVEDHHEIARDMKEWIEKMRTHLSYMSDVITAIKGQAVAFSEQTASGFTIKELINYVDILMKHELKNALINLNTQADIDTSTTVKGNINSLVQVINNIISNSIQAYQSQGKTNENINFRIFKKGNNIVFRIEDFAGGLPEKVQEKLFKEMITTKGKNGTGLGLFMSYSNIKAHFNGNLKYETEAGKGTAFIIEIPA